MNFQSIEMFISSFYVENRLQKNKKSVFYRCFVYFIDKLFFLFQDKFYFWFGNESNNKFYNN